jgi:hypothetical protein
MRIRTPHCAAQTRPVRREASPIACAYATAVTFQFKVIAGQVWRRPVAPFVRRAQPRSTAATPSITRSRQTASAIRNLPPRSRTGRRIIPGCTCNGRDAFGLVNPAVADDPTLRPGDIVATNAGLMAYNGGPNGSTFTPISTHAGLSADLRRQLAETKVEPTAEGPELLPPLRQAEAPPARSTMIGELRSTVGIRILFLAG